MLCPLCMNRHAKWMDIYHFRKILEEKAEGRVRSPNVPGISQPKSRRCLETVSQLRVAQASPMNFSTLLDKPSQLQLLLAEFAIDKLFSKPTTIYADNQGAIALAANPEHHPRSKHIDIRYHFQRQEVEAGSCQFRYIPTAGQAADGFTKPLARVAFGRFVQQLGLRKKLFQHILAAYISNLTGLVSILTHWVEPCFSEGRHGLLPSLWCRFSCRLSRQANPIVSSDLVSTQAAPENIEPGVDCAFRNGREIQVIQERAQRFSLPPRPFPSSSPPSS